MPPPLVAHSFWNLCFLAFLHLLELEGPTELLYESLISGRDARCLLLEYISDYIRLPWKFIAPSWGFLVLRCIQSSSGRDSKYFDHQEYVDTHLLSILPLPQLPSILACFFWCAFGCSPTALEYFWYREPIFRSWLLTLTYILFSTDGIPRLDITLGGQLYRYSFKMHCHADMVYFDGYISHIHLIVVFLYTIYKINYFFCC